MHRRRGASRRRVEIHPRTAHRASSRRSFPTRAARRRDRDPVHSACRAHSPPRGRRSPFHPWWRRRRPALLRTARRRRRPPSPRRTPARRRAPAPGDGSPPAACGDRCCPCRTARRGVVRSSPCPFLLLAIRWSRRGNGVTVQENAISRRRLTKPMDIAEFRSELTAWLDAHHAELAPTFSPPGTLDDDVAQMQRVKAQLFDAGWMRWGWPERVGGLGGSPMLRTELGAALAARDLTDPGLYSLVEVLAPTLIDFASPELAAEFVPRLLSGAEVWCQGFSEPEAGSDLGSLSCRAVADGRAESTASWVINGQKVWTSLAQYSDRCVLLARTGSTESRHRGITAFFVDMDSPGIAVAPIEM